MGLVLGVSDSLTISSSSLKKLLLSTFPSATAHLTKPVYRFVSPDVLIGSIRRTRDIHHGWSIDVGNLFPRLALSRFYEIKVTSEPFAIGEVISKSRSEIVIIREDQTVGIVDLKTYKMVKPSDDLKKNAWAVLFE